MEKFILLKISQKLSFYKNEYSCEIEVYKENDASKRVLKFIAEKLSHQTNWTEKEIKSLVNETAEVTGVKGKDLYFPLRLSLFGSPNGPDISLLVDILGVHESTNRLKKHT